MFMTFIKQMISSTQERNKSKKTPSQ